MKSVLKENKKLLKELVYEEVNGKPIYYKNYKLVIKGKKTLEEVMASSIFQSRIITALINLLSSKLNPIGYLVLGSELGVRTKKGFRSIDIAIYRKDDIKAYKNLLKYVPITPLICIEVDTKAELKNKDIMDYISEKINDLFQKETNKVIWILTKPRIILIAQKGKSWEIKKWDDDIEVMENITFNLDKLLREVGI
ncbi:MAG: Uma2 family endonuclease [candidate division WOR-3 bacterium]